MGLKLIVVGKTKKPFFEQSEKEYLKRLNKYCKLNYTTVSSSKKSDQKDVCLNMEEEDRYNCENYFQLPYNFL